jgi:hypothetical protein
MAENGNCYYIVDVIIYLDSYGSLDQIIELTNGEWLNTKGEISEYLEAIVRHLNNIY